MDSIWNKINEVLCRSGHEVRIFEGSAENGQSESQKLGIPDNSALASVVINSSGIYIDDWIRILGQGNAKRNGLMHFNSMVNHRCLDGMFVIATDAAGGIFAINISRFETEKNVIWYFAPDTLEWESLGMEYSRFIVWTVQGNTDGFYESMRWDGWRNDCKNLEFNSGFLIYPFLWARECDINTADKKVVLFEELMNLNFDFCNKL